MGLVCHRCWLTDKSKEGAFPKNAKNAYTLYVHQNRRVSYGKHASPL
jgi:hypothetical protein